MAFIPAKCSQCGADINIDNSKEFGFCSNCGTKYITERIVNQKVTHVEKQVNYYVNEKNKDTIECPNCGSTNVQFVSKTEGGGYSITKGLLGGLICLPGVLCGLNKTKTNTVRKCMNCGEEF